MGKRGWFFWIIGGALVWALWGPGSHPAAAQVREGNSGRGGETLEIKNLLDRSRTTAIDFSSPYCPPCVRLAPLLEQLAARLPEVAFVKVNINRREVQGIDWKSPLAQQYRIRSVPYFMIFDPQGKLVAQGMEAWKTIEGWLQKTGVGQEGGK